jgi:hypothetical protein
MARERKVVSYTVPRKTGKNQYTVYARDRDGRTVNLIRGDNEDAVCKAARRAWPHARKRHPNEREY